MAGFSRIWATLFFKSLLPTAVELPYKSFRFPKVYSHYRAPNFVTLTVTFSVFLP
jgi:hypothetical protein